LELVREPGGFGVELALFRFGLVLRHRGVLLLLRLLLGLDPRVDLLEVFEVGAEELDLADDFVCRGLPRSQ
jgi:hypothetical protein